jgi:D-alanyl-D-alanine carboxypeptidase/D-alanyl-D-alanine-endopeptidase (penicillin-binding protein 4)
MIHLLLLAAALSAEARQAAPDRLKAALEAVMDGPDYAHAHWGALVVDRDSGRTVYERNADKLFAPASVTKLFSTAAALRTFGADHRFRTPVYALGPITPEGVLRGDLLLVASGDPTLGGRTTAEGRIAFKDSDHIYANGNETGELTEPDPLAGLRALAAQVREAGVRQVDGDVLIDDRLFDKAEGTGSGPWRLTPIMLNDNLIDVVATPGKPGEPARVEWRPETSAWRVDAQVRTVAAGGATRVWIDAPAPGRLALRGTIAADRKPLLRVHEVEDAASFARACFIEALRREGIRVDASPGDAHPVGKLPPPAAAGDRRRVAELVSPPFSENLRLILKVSHNLHASTLPLLAAARNGGRTLEEGMRLQGEALRKLGVEVEAISFGGGAGGARADAVTPRATVQLLRGLAADPGFALFEESLPVLGVDGTLASAVTADSPARGKARAKTGTLFWEDSMNGRFLVTSKALAGTLTTARERRLLFALFVNGTHVRRAADTAREGKTLGRLCEILHESE